jgi:hypothetical protein
LQLQPKHPPGRKSRKVRAYSEEIRRLQAEGYTCDEIRAALADVGVVVSRSTVQREAARVLQRRNPTSATVATAVSQPPPAPSTAASPIEGLSPLPSRRAEPGDLRSVRQVAEDFMKSQHTNLLLHTERKR